MIHPQGQKGVRISFASSLCRALFLVRSSRRLKGSGEKESALHAAGYRMNEEADFIAALNRHAVQYRLFRMPG